MNKNEAPDIEEIGERIKKLKPIVILFHSQKNKHFIEETKNRIKGSTTHLYIEDLTLTFEYKTTLPGDSFNISKPQEIIEFYTQKLYNSTKELEISNFLHQRGCVHFDNFQYELCENDFKESLKFNINNGLLYMDFCDLYLLQNKFEDGILMAEKSIFLQPNLALGRKFHLKLAYMGLAQCFIELGREDEALKCYHQSIIIDPYFLEGYYDMGYVYKRIFEDNTSAFYCFTFVISVAELMSEIDDVNSLYFAHRYRGEILIESGREEEGFEDLYETINLNPGNHQNLVTISR
jgi:tetratricopeptide (TPR) repeat protein